MKELLASLEAFGQNPEAVGDNLFAFFAQITHMGWADVIAAGAAIGALSDEAFRKAQVIAESKGEEHKYDAIKDPTHTRLESCLVPCVMRVGQLLAEAPKEQQAMLFHSVSGRGSFIQSRTRDRWAKTLGIAEE